MEQGRLLHARTSKQHNRMATPAKEEEQQQHLDSTVSLMLPPPPPPPPDPETVAAAVAAPMTCGSAAAASTEAAAASETLPDPSAKDVIEGNRGRKRASPATTETPLGLIPVAQQTWKRRRKQRKRAAAAEAAPARVAEMGGSTLGLSGTTTGGAVP